MADNEPRTTVVLRRFLNEADEIASDLTEVEHWLTRNEDTLTDDVVHNLRVYGTSFLDSHGLVVKIYCKDPAALARVTRTLIRGAGKGQVTKRLTEDHGHSHVRRQFGRVAIDAWAARYPCTTESRVAAGAVQTTITCPPLLSLVAS